MKSKFYQHSLKQLLGSNFQVSFTESKDKIMFKIIGSSDDKVLFTIFTHNNLYNNWKFTDIFTDKLFILDRVIEFSEMAGLLLTNFRIYHYLKKALTFFLNFHISLKFDNNLYKLSLFKTKRNIVEITISNFYFDNVLYLKRYIFNDKISYQDLLVKLEKYSINLGINKIKLDINSKIILEKDKKCEIPLLDYYLYSRDKNWIIPNKIIDLDEIEKTIKNKSIKQYFQELSLSDLTEKKICEIFKICQKLNNQFNKIPSNTTLEKILVNKENFDLSKYTKYAKYLKNKKIDLPKLGIQL